MLSNKYLRTIMKKIYLKKNDNIKNNKIKELYDILLSSNISININIENEEIIYNGKKISLIDINLEDINCFKF